MLLIGIGVAAFLVLKVQYDAKDGNYNSVGEICADLEGSFTEGDEIWRLCTEYGADEADVGLDDPIICTTEIKDESFEYLGDVTEYDGETFTMREILEADDVQAKYDEVAARCGADSDRKLAALRGSDAGERNLLADYGWCSTNAFFAIGWASDSSNYCDTGQDCDSWAGCGSSLSRCCITHDQCLHSDDKGINVHTNSRCTEGNCKGRSCDANLCRCNKSTRCSYKWKCGWWKCWGYSFACGIASGEVNKFMCAGSSSPQAGWNSDGQWC